VASKISTASIIQQMGVTTVSGKLDLMDANVILVDSVHHSSVKAFPLVRLMPAAHQAELDNNHAFVVRTQFLKYDSLVRVLSQTKYSEWYTVGKSEIYDALALRVIADDDDLAATVNSHIKTKSLEGIVIECRDLLSVKPKPKGNTIHLGTKNSIADYRY
jgi:hypothetical protein